MGHRKAECGVLLVNDRRIAELNRAFRGVDAPTDVLAFSMREGPGADWPPDLLGDVVISAERANSQAREQGHSLEEELCFLLVHGLLHLLGWDDSRPMQRKKMLQVQEEIVRDIFPQGLGKGIAGSGPASRTA